jgi:hypothetical protein
MTTQRDADAAPRNGGASAVADVDEARAVTHGPRDPSAAHGDGGPGRSATALAWAPGATTVLVAFLVLLDNDVAVGELLRYAAYWLGCVLVPGMLVYRALVGRRPFLGEDLAFGAVTGVALEILAWLVLDGLGLFSLVRWWWVLPYGLFLGVPKLRRHWSRGFERATPGGWAWAMAGLTIVVLVTLAVGGFRSNVIAPTAGPVYVDQWYHLSIVQELMRSGPHELPQVAGVPLRYHLFSHAHMANAANVSGVMPDLVLMRLWPVPIIAVTLVLVGGLARQVAGRVWTAPVAAWLAAAGLAGRYLWVDRGVGSASPFVYLSPSQLLANPVLVAASTAFVALGRGRRSWGLLAWFSVLVVAGVGAKPTVLPVLGVGAALAIAARWIIDRRFPRMPALALGTVVVVQGAWLTTAPPKSGGVTILGTLSSISVYRDLVSGGEQGLRAVSEGLVLDSLTGSRAWAAAGVALLWLTATQAVRLVGLAGLGQRAMRRDPAAWFLGGGVVAGYGAFLVFDHPSFSQAYFVTTVIPLGAVLGTWLLATLLEPAERSVRRRAVGLGIATGVAISLVIRGFVSGRSSSPVYGAVESALTPIVLVGAAWLIGRLVWWRNAERWGVSGLGAAVVVTALFSMTIPAAASALTRQIGTFTIANPAANAPAGSPATEDELAAMLWLRENTGEHDLVATNVHCREPDSRDEFCDARSFLVSGVGGRRVLLEGWAYTGEALALHGFEGRAFRRQESPWPERSRLSREVFSDPDASAIEELRREYGVQWLVAVRRAGEESDDLRDLATLVYENADVGVYRI